MSDKNKDKQKNAVDDKVVYLDQFRNLEAKVSGQMVNLMHLEADTNNLWFDVRALKATTLTLKHAVIAQYLMLLAVMALLWWLVKG